jgi:hypothetical protein
VVVLIVAVVVALDAFVYFLVLDVIEVKRAGGRQTVIVLVFIFLLLMLLMLMLLVFVGPGGFNKFFKFDELVRKAKKKWGFSCFSDNSFNLK